jgi:hypothetical protein
VTYEAATGYTPSDVKFTDKLNVNNMDVQGLIITGGVTEDDIAAGVYDGGAVEIFLVNWQSLSDGTIKLHRGTVGQIFRDENMFVAELRGIEQILQQNITENYSATCRADLGDARCKIRIDPPAWAATTAYTERLTAEGGSGSVVKPTTDNGRHFKCTTAGTSGGSEPTWDTTIGNTTNDGTAVWTTIRALSQGGTVTAVTDRSNFADSALTEPDGWWSLGAIAWLTGNNAGRSMEVKESTSAGGLFEIYLPMVSDIQVGDTFTVQTGCGKLVEDDCRDKFDNINNARAEPFISGLDAFLTNDT